MCMTLAALIVTCLGLQASMALAQQRDAGSNRESDGGFRLLIQDPLAPRIRSWCAGICVGAPDTAALPAVGDELKRSSESDGRSRPISQRFSN